MVPTARTSRETPTPYKDISSAFAVGDTSVLKQRAKIMNNFCSEWSMEIEFLFVHWGVSNFLILAIDLDEDVGLDWAGSYSSCMVGVPDRSYLWIMTRSREAMSASLLELYMNKAEDLGYNSALINRVPYIRTAEEDAMKPSSSLEEMIEEEKESLDKVDFALKLYSSMSATEQEKLKTTLHKKLFNRNEDV